MIKRHEFVHHAIDQMQFFSRDHAQSERYYSEIYPNERTYDEWIEWLARYLVNRPPEDNDKKKKGPSGW
jgi:hypothetical protein